ncbi:MAG TPA: nuclear transport factor 2 family protein [Terriglobales bacterium]|nr:nuclear transport factor 2 family protein [Terriglobales bacterium]
MSERVQASLAGDTERVAAFLSDDYLQTDISGHIQDKTTWLKEYFIPLAQLINAGRFRWDKYDQSELRFRIYKDFAVVMGRLDAQGTGAKWSPEQHTWVADPNATFKATLWFTHVYKKQNGKWLLVALQNAVPVGPPASAK